MLEPLKMFQNLGYLKKQSGQYEYFLLQMDLTYKMGNFKHKKIILEPVRMFQNRYKITPVGWPGSHAIGLTSPGTVSFGAFHLRYFTVSPYTVCTEPEFLNIKGTLARDF